MSVEQPTGDELGMATRVGRFIGSRWSGVDTDDVVAELYLWLIRNRKSVVRWRTDPHGVAKLYVSLKREAIKVCAHEQARANGGSLFKESRFYTVELLTRALPFIFEDTPQTAVHEHPGSGQPVGVPDTFDNALTIMTDIRSEFYGLRKDYRHVLELRFRDGLTFEEIAELEGLTKDGAAKRVQRALTRLSDCLSDR